MTSLPKKGFSLVGIFSKTNDCWRFSLCFQRQVPGPIFVSFHSGGSHSNWYQTSSSVECKCKNYAKYNFRFIFTQIQILQCLIVVVLVLNLFSDIVTCLKVKPGLEPPHGEVKLDLEKATHLEKVLFFINLEKVLFFKTWVQFFLYLGM